MAQPKPVRDSRQDLLRSVARDPLAARVARRLTERCRVNLARPLDTSPTRLLVGCSGGPDSTALLLLLAALCRRRSVRCELRVVAIHHGLREAAKEECAMVARLCRRLEIPCERIDVRPAERRGNVAANARDDRYEALREAARRHDAATVVVAHHAADRLESILLSMVRGRGLRGLASPTWRRSLGQGVTLVRPLLDSSKEELIALCDRLEVPYATDPSNSDPKRARGFLRRSILPGLVERWPRLEEHASRLADEAMVALRAIERLAHATLAGELASDGTHQWRRSACQAADPTLVAWAIRAVAVTRDRSQALGVTRITWERIARAACDRQPEPRHFRLGPTMTCAVRSERVILLVSPTHS